MGSTPTYVLSDVEYNGTLDGAMRRLADRAHVSVGSIKDWRRGSHAPASIETAEALAKAQKKLEGLTDKFRAGGYTAQQPDGKTPIPRPKIHPTQVGNMLGSNH